MTEEMFAALCERIDHDQTPLRIVEITDDEYAELSREDAARLVERFGGNTLIPLPAREREFFDWLREADPSVWDDLWGDEETPYRVSLAFLPDLLPKGRGFLICDLVGQQNFNFGVENITQDEGVGVLDAAMEILRANGRLGLYQAFLIEVWRAPIDQWRFAWMYTIALESVKEMVIWLVSEGILTLPHSNEHQVGPNVDDGEIDA